ncbi:MAG: EscU/YscU/HrcU family type III secretion system export apparatus switch protein [Holosporales bacterium]|jgi:flagellar biosynthetic protein FlhB|nr:EscU/YscU/HrcU family type III secretion system export apparatus switch protein [Holosporales bacterium]
MAEESEKNVDQKPFEATEHRLREAREKGQIPLSNDLNIAIMLFASAVVILAIGPSVCTNITTFLAPFIQEAHAIHLDPAVLRKIIEHCAWSIGKIALFVGATFLTLTLFSTALQTRFVIAWNRLKPDPSRISLKKGIERLFSWRGLVEFLKNIFKCSVAGVIATYVLWTAVKSSTNTIGVAPAQWFLVMRGDIFKMFLYVLLFMLFIGGADYWYQWQQHRRQLRMTHQEMKEEQKQHEGDPHMRSRVRQIREERMRQLMETSLQHTTVVVVDAKYCAVALKYNTKMSAPVVTAKGVETYAQTICAFARSKKIPVIQNAPLARVLFSDAKVHQEIPVAHYKATAEVIGRIIER